MDLLFFRSKTNEERREGILNRRIRMENGKFVLFSLNEEKQHKKKKHQRDGSFSQKCD